MDSVGYKKQNEEGIKLGGGYGGVWEKLWEWGWIWSKYIVSMYEITGDYIIKIVF